MAPKRQLKPPRKPKRKRTLASSEDDTTPSVANDNAEDSSEEAFTRMAKQMIGNAKKRREARREEQSSAFLKQTARLEKDIEAAFDDTQSEQKRRGQMEHLVKLTNRKAKIRSRIVEKVKELEKEYLLAGQELSIILTARKEDMENVLKPSEGI